MATGSSHLPLLSQVLNRRSVVFSGKIRALSDFPEGDSIHASLAIIFQARLFCCCEDLLAISVRPRRLRIKVKNPNVSAVTREAEGKVTIKV